MLKEKEVNKSCDEEKDNSVKDNPFFMKRSINSILQKTDRNKVLDYIRANYPITPYKLSKDLNIAYTTIAKICKEFEFCGLIKFEVVIGDNNRTHKEIYIENGNK